MNEGEHDHEGAAQTRTAAWPPVPVPGEDPECSADPVIEPGTPVGAYVIDTVLGRGGFAAVYRARHSLLARTVAIKVLHGHLLIPGVAERFAREAWAIAQLRHPNIVDIFDSGALPDGRPFYVMELLEGATLRRHLAAAGRLGPAEVLAILDPVARALEAAHHAGFVHRDVKASNIMVLPGVPPVVKLLDFGIVKLVRPDPSQTSLTTGLSRPGTVDYMAPEQIRGDPVDHRADIYALGVLLFELLTGRLPFFSAGNLHATEVSHLTAPPPRPSDWVPISPRLDQVVLCCLAKKPDDRYPSAAEFLRELGGAVGATASPGVCPGRRAAGIYVELHLGDASEEELEQAGAWLDQAVQELSAAGMIIALETGNSVLGIKLLDDAAGAGRAERRRVAHLAQALHARMKLLAATVPVTVTAHADAIVMSGERPAAGPILEIGIWGGRTAGGLHTTAELVADLGAED